jgi:hypothetical protein
VCEPEQQWSSHHHGNCTRNKTSEKKEPGLCDGVKDFPDRTSGDCCDERNDGASRKSCVRLPRFDNRVSERLKEKHGDVRDETAAYEISSEADKLKSYNRAA